MATKQGNTTVSRRVVLGAGIGGAGLLASGCSVFGDDGGTGGGSGEAAGPSITTATTHAIDALDPHYVSSSMYILPSGLMEGLLMQNEDGTDAVPALAESFDVSEDELEYTFHMREGATWSNGDPITSADAMFSFERLLTPTGAGSGYTTGASSYLPSMGIRGAADFQAGALSTFDEVGITAPDDASVVIELDSPNPDFLLNMTHYSMTVLHQASVEADETGWAQPENWVGNGPYLLTQWDPTTVVEMKANPEYWDADNVQVQHITVQLGGDAPTNVLSFRNSDLDIISVSGTALQGDPELEESVSRVDGYATHYLQTMWGGHPAIQDQKVRQALSLAIDREALAASDPGLQSGVSLIPDSVPGWSDELATPFDVDAAKALLEEAGVAEDLPGLRIQAGFESPFLQILQEGLINSLGMDVVIDVLEAGVHADTRWKPAEDDSYMSFYYGSFAGVSTMPNWTLNIFGADHVRQFSMPYEAWEELQATQADESLQGPELAARVEEVLSTQSTPEAQQYAQMAKEAMTILDEEERTSAFIDAALLREQMSFTIPMVWGAQMYATSDQVSGLHPRSSPEGYYFKTLTVSE